MHPEELEQTIDRYRRRGVLVDSNLLLLYFVGEHSRDLVTTCKRTSEYTPAHFDHLKVLIENFAVIYTTPNILTEVSNLSKSIPDSIRRDYYAEFTKKVVVLEEEFVESRSVSEDPHLWRLGLTDCVIGHLAKGKCLVLTVDLKLAIHLQTLGIGVVNFNHIRFGI